jgi:hypothetical protein
MRVPARPWPRLVRVWRRRALRCCWGRCWRSSSHARQLLCIQVVGDVVRGFCSAPGGAAPRCMRPRGAPMMMPPCSGGSCGFIGFRHWNCNGGCARHWCHRGASLRQDRPGDDDCRSDCDAVQEMFHRPNLRSGVNDANRREKPSGGLIRPKNLTSSRRMRRRLVSPPRPTPPAGKRAAPAALTKRV